MPTCNTNHQARSGAQGMAMLAGSHCSVGSTLAAAGRLRAGRLLSCVDGAGHVAEHQAAGSVHGSLRRQQHLQGTAELRASTAALAQGCVWARAACLELNSPLPGEPAWPTRH